MLYKISKIICFDIKAVIDEITIIHITISNNDHFSPIHDEKSAN